VQARVFGKRNELSLYVPKRAAQCGQYVGAGIFFDGFVGGWR